MDYERKYKDALGWMQSLYDGLHGATKEDAEHYFPELKESEDERIRKGIIKYLDWIKDRDGSYMPNNIPFDDMISWLEKQAKKPADMVEPKDYSSIDPHFFKHTDKVEPKFHEGDWVVLSTSDGEKVVQIDSIEYFKSGEPRYITSEGKWFGNGTKARLWDIIKDAKDGDVLVNGSNIFIFHFINDTRLMGYCHVNTDDGRFYDDIGKNECFCLIDAIVTPATKEQRDLLFQKMHGAGYAFDFDKKELKKKSQRMISAEAKEALYDKPTWSEEDERICSNIVNDIANDKSMCKYEISKGICDEQINWIKSLKQRIGG